VADIAGEGRTALSRVLVILASRAVRARRIHTHMDCGRGPDIAVDIFGVLPVAQDRMLDGAYAQWTRLGQEGKAEKDAKNAGPHTVIVTGEVQAGQMGSRADVPIARGWPSAVRATGADDTSPEKRKSSPCHYQADRARSARIEPGSPPPRQKPIEIPIYIASSDHPSPSMVRNGTPSPCYFSSNAAPSPDRSQSSAGALSWQTC
jgi:hypothetical protein